MENRHQLLGAGLASLILLGACNKAPTADTAAEAAAAAQAQADTAAAEAVAKAREAELAQREADLAAREAEVAAAARPATPQPAARPAPAPRPVVNTRPITTPTTTPAMPAATNPVVTPVVLTVPSGTQLSLALATSLSTKNAKVGDVVRARVTQDVRVNDRVAIAAGSIVAGQVTDVVSGSDKIGGVPALGLRFERLELPGNVDVPIEGTLTQKGKSDAGRDTAKIVGGAAAGAILGHQVKGGDKGKVLGGLLGGAVGAVAAQKTGTEVALTEGTELAITLAAPVEITRR